MKKTIGLTTQQAIANKAKGSNELTQRERESFWDMLKESLQDTWLKILMVALALEVVFYVIGRIWPDMGSDDWFSAVAIFIVIIAVSFISTYINYKQDRGAQALQREASQIKVKVYRDGQLIELSINDIVCEDCVFLQPGDKIPADGILIDGSLKVDQAALNGESREAEKIVLGDNPVPSNDDLFTKFKCFRGSVVTSGSAIMQVTDVGDNTVLGTINVSLQEKDESKTPSEEKLDKLAKNIGTFGYCGGAAAAVIHLILGIINMSHYTVGNIAYLILSSLVLGVSIIVMAVPEGLPLMNTLVQGLNVGKMLKAHIYVKNPKAIETAGYLTHIFTDKTGTLTNGKMTVANVITGDSTVYEDFDNICDSVREDIIIGAGVNNDATISGDGKAIGSNDTDRALITYLAIENGVNIDKSVIESSEPFDSKVKYASVTMPDGVKYMKGAPDIIMNECTSYIDKNGDKQTLTSEIQSKLKETWDAQTERAMRVIAIVKESANEKTFVALISIRDDVRKDVKDSVKKMLNAGVNVTMVTGDVLATAKAIAREAGLITKPTDLCITHEELARMSDKELIKALPNLKVVARAVPSDKERLVEISKSIGEVVGMTGDGVNDASALHKADVGFAMGSGTEVAKEAGDIIILNDSLTSIADAIMYGRTMSKSVKKFIIFQLTVNVSTVFTAVLGPILGWTEVFTIIQILWINMIMDTLAAIAFGQEPARESYMREKPVARTADILNKYLKSAILVGGVFITIICLGILKNIFGIYNIIGSTDISVIRTFMFATFILAILWNSLNARTESMNLFEHIHENHNFIIVMLAVAAFQIIIIQFGGKVFGTTPLTLSNWIVAILIAFMIIPIDLIRKAIVNKMGIKE
ncbi:MAG: calcium-translocating P-type ATPase, PMCA-type [Clostridia bacterium]|nr:calcium-translocating P-type ATPase, PMCA-type [Clostridia bacterium]